VNWLNSHRMAAFIMAATAFIGALIIVMYIVSDTEIADAINNMLQWNGPDWNGPSK
jgi:predicted PurR-regulated permease PerM